MSFDAPIGIFDSGLGGLTVAKKVLDRLPRESIAYAGDEINIPYGERSAQEIRSLALGITEFLIGRKAKLVIMACNMSSATALSAAQEAFPDVPVIGVIEAGVRAAVRAATGAPIGVLATTGTVKTGAYARLISCFLPETPVYEQACPKFVSLVEAGAWDTPKAEDAVREYASPLLDAGCRTLILGCTHYPFLADTIRRAAGPGVALIDPAEETAVEAANILFDAGVLNPPHVEPVHSYFTSARPDKFAELGSRFMGRTIRGVEQITWGLDLRAIEWQEKTVEPTTKSAR